jgi:hypothetical protein
MGGSTRRVLLFVLLGLLQQLLEHLGGLEPRVVLRVLPLVLRFRIQCKSRGKKPTFWSVNFHHDINSIEEQLLELTIPFVQELETGQLGGWNGLQPGGPG